jgi:hypothetical protein
MSLFIGSAPRLAERHRLRCRLPSRHHAHDALLAPNSSPGVGRISFVKRLQGASLFELPVLARAARVFLHHTCRRAGPGGSFPRARGGEALAGVCQARTPRSDSAADGAAWGRKSLCPGLSLASRCWRESSISSHGLLLIGMFEPVGARCAGPAQSAKVGPACKAQRSGLRAKRNKGRP